MRFITFFKIILPTILGTLLFVCEIQGQPEVIVANRIIEDIEKPIGMHWAPGEEDQDRFYLQFHAGQMIIFENGQPLETPFLDLGPEGLDIIDFESNSEQGFNGFEFDPDYANNGYVYVNYNGVRPDGTGNPIEQRLICFQRDNMNPNVLNTELWYELLEFDEGDDPQYGHNGGQVEFGPDGYLYVSCGDGGGTGNGTPGGGSGGDDHGPIGNGQNLKTFLGKILRIQAHGMEPYSIPEDNPFVGDTSAFDEIWAYGFRNPWRFTFDKETGDKWIGDVGEVDWEEINFESADSPGGMNFGWRLLEGSSCYEPIVDCDPDGITELPVFEYPHTNGWCATIGGYRYRGSKIPTLDGYFILGDFCGFNGDKFWLVNATSGNFESSILEIQVPGGFTPWQENVYGFSEDPNGELFLITSIAIYSLQYDPDAPISADVEVDIYPNPATDQITIQKSEGKVFRRIEVWDSMGRLVEETNLVNVQNTLDLNTSNLRAGNYIIKLFYEGDDIPSIHKFCVLGVSSN